MSDPNASMFQGGDVLADVLSGRQSFTEEESAAATAQIEELWDDSDFEQEEFDEAMFGDGSDAEIVELSFFQRHMGKILVPIVVAALIGIALLAYWFIAEPDVMSFQECIDYYVHVQMVFPGCSEIAEAHQNNLPEFFDNWDALFGLISSAPESWTH